MAGAYELKMIVEINIVLCIIWLAKKLGNDILTITALCGKYIFYIS